MTLVGRPLSQGLSNKNTYSIFKQSFPPRLSDRWRMFLISQPDSSAASTVLTCLFITWSTSASCPPTVTGHVRVCRI